MAVLTTRSMILVGIAIFALPVMTGAAGAETTGRDLEEVEQPFPVGETLGYAVSWMGIRCGHMDITSFTETDADGGTIYRITLHAQTTKFFDGMIVDLSGAGAAITNADDALQSGMEIGLSFQLGDELFRIPGRVLYISDPKRLAHIAFEKLAPAVQDRIIRGILRPSTSSS